MLLRNPEDGAPVPVQTGGWKALGALVFWIEMDGRILVHLRAGTDTVVLDNWGLELLELCYCWPLLHEADKAIADNLPVKFIYK